MQKCGKINPSKPKKYPEVGIFLNSRIGNFDQGD